MFAYLILLFTVVPAVELALLIKIGGHIGVANTLLVIILTGIWGAYLARLQGFSILQKIQHNLEKGVMPTEEMLDGVMVLVGGIVLLTPGFITDTMGFLLLIPVTRHLIKAFFRSRIQKMMAEGQIVTMNSQREQKYRDAEDADFEE